MVDSKESVRLYSYKHFSFTVIFSSWPPSKLPVNLSTPDLFHKYKNTLTITQIQIQNSANSTSTSPHQAYLVALSVASIYDLTLLSWSIHIVEMVKTAARMTATLTHDPGNIEDMLNWRDQCSPNFCISGAHTGVLLCCCYYLPFRIYRNNFMSCDMLSLFYLLFQITITGHC